MCIRDSVILQDVITSNRLDDLWENQQVPTLEAVQRQFTEETSAKQQEHLSGAGGYGVSEKS